MNTASPYMTVSGIDIDVVYKQIKNLHIAVYPPLGRVRVAAPERYDDDAIRMAVIQRLPWIKRQREEFRKTERQSEREMVNGESHYVWGQRYRLKVVHAPGKIRIEQVGNKLVMIASEESTTEQRQEAMTEWYRDELKREIPLVIRKWERELQTIVPKWTVRRMKTKWGSCNRESRHIWLNLELAKKNPSCLEYIIVHEMTHYVEGKHNDRFAELMDQRLPDWRSRRSELNGAPLSDEDWD